MKKQSRLSARQLIFSAVFLLIFTGMTFFLFAYQRDQKRFANITTELFTKEMEANTLSMHYTLADPKSFGIYDYTPTLVCYRSESSLNSQAKTENTLAALQNIHTENLSESDAYLCRLLIRSLTNSLEMSAFSYYSEPLSPASGAQSQLPILLAEYSFRSQRDVEDYLALLGQTDEYFSSLLTYEQEKAAAGLSMPAAFLKEVREQCDSILTKEALETETHFLQTTFQERLEPLVKEGEITVTQAQNYIAQNHRLLKTVLLPAYTALGDGLLLLEDQSVLPCGLAGLPDGKAYYEKLLISETGSYRPISEIQKLLSDRFSSEYDQAAAILASHPLLAESYAHEEAGSFPYKDASQMLLDLQQRMGGSFPPIPGEAAQAAVKALSPSLEAYCAPAFYLTAPLDDTNANTIYINKKKTPGGLDLYTTLAHEGYPGHLYQTVYYNRHAYPEGERPVRELLWYGGYQEGWALYVEFLAYDYAAQLLQEYGQQEAALGAQLEKHNRSMQLSLYCLLDILIHYEGASYSQIAKVLERFGYTDSAAIKSLYHYIVQEPCNYLKYYLGYLEILDLQQKAKSLWGSAYSDYNFHCFYLDSGPSGFRSLEEGRGASPPPSVAPDTPDPKGVS